MNKRVFVFLIVLFVSIGFLYLYLFQYGSGTYKKDTVDNNAEGSSNITLDTGNINSPCLGWLEQEGLDEIVERFCENYEKKQYDKYSDIFVIISFNKDNYKSPSGEESSFLKEMKECKSLPHALKRLFVYNLECLKKQDDKGKVRIRSLEECKGIFKLYYADSHVAIIHLSNYEGIANIIVFKNPKFVVVGQQIFFYDPQKMCGDDLKNAVVYVNQSIFSKQIMDEHNEFRGENMLSYIGVPYRKISEEERKGLDIEGEQSAGKKIDILCEGDGLIIYATLLPSGEHSDFYFDVADVEKGDVMRQ